MGLQLHPGLVFQVPVFLPQVCPAAFRMDDPFPHLRQFEEAVAAISLPEDGQVLPAPQALVLYQADRQASVQQEVHMDEVPRQEQVVGHGILPFRLHFAQHSFVLHKADFSGKWIKHYL